MATSTITERLADLIDWPLTLLDRAVDRAITWVPAVRFTGPAPKTAAAAPPAAAVAAIPVETGPPPASVSGGGRICLDCRGHGEIRHPRWGSRDCPEETIACPRCDGGGELDTYTSYTTSRAPGAGAHANDCRYIDDPWHKCVDAGGYEQSQVCWASIVARAKTVHPTGKAVPA